MQNTIPVGEKLQELSEVSSRTIPYSILDPNRQLVLEGDVLVPLWFVAAKEIVFKPGARLVFSLAAIQNRQELFVVAEKITVEAGVGVITWEKVAPPPPPDRGQAPTGAHGSGDGASGIPGADGAAGVSGTMGYHAPDLSLAVQTLGGGGNLSVDFSGGAGGTGGLGQRGGDGGSGARGGRARQARQSGPFGSTVWLPWCEAGPGAGGRGGNGGRGGDGGVGGEGGDGGTVTFCSDANRLVALRHAIHVQNDGGSGGPGGSGAPGGRGGPGGAEGELANFCGSAGRVGPDGSGGSPGSPGPGGVPGGAGASFDCLIPDDQFRRLFGYGVQP